MADQLALVLDVLRPLARVREARWNGPPDAPPLAEPEHVWLDGVAHAKFERSLVDSTRAAAATATPITAIDLLVDLHVWVRTGASPRVPVRGWVCGAARVALQFEREDPYGALEIHHTLFMDGNLAGDPNTELHRLNQPLLRDLLASIESRLGPITEIEGLPGVGRTGFASLEP